MTRFSCTDITRQYRRFRLDRISFTMESGYLYVLTGVNGSGKTTLLDCISGRNLFSSPGFRGNARIDDITMRDSFEEYRQRVVYISENVSFFTEESVAQNGLTYGQFYPKWSVRDYSHYLGRLEIDASKRIWQLSKGEFIKFQLCFALACHPDFLFMDEPLEGLDPVSRRHFLHLLGDMLDQNTGILLSTHITEDVDRLADYILILENGHLAANTSKENFSDLYRQKTGLSSPHIRDLLELEHQTKEWII